MNFSINLILWTSTLHENVTSILMNMLKIKDFQMERGVKQGYPLVHYLYLLVANVQSVMFVDLTYLVHGLTLPNGYILQDLFLLLMTLPF